MKHIGACRTVVGKRGVPRPKIPRSFGILLGRLRSLTLSIHMLHSSGARIGVVRDISCNRASLHRVVRKSEGCHSRGRSFKSRKFARGRFIKRRLRSIRLSRRPSSDSLRGLDFSSSCLNRRWWKKTIFVPGGGRRRCRPLAFSTVGVNLTSPRGVLR